MSCCPSDVCAGTNRFFSRWSKHDARQFRKKGLDKIQAMILDGIGDRSSSSRHILDIGCGIGALHLTLLRRGSDRATGIDVSTGMIQQARTLSAELELKNRTTYIEGDFVDVAGNVQAADITLLDKVVCCYSNADALLRASIDKTSDILAMSHPREHFGIRWAFKVQIFFERFLRSAFHPYWHDWRALQDLVLSSGFSLRYENRSFVWKVLVFERRRPA